MTLEKLTEDPNGRFFLNSKGKKVNPKEEIAHLSITIPLSERSKTFADSNIGTFFECLYRTYPLFANINAYTLESHNKDDIVIFTFYKI